MDLDAMAESLQAIIESVPSEPQPNARQPIPAQPNPTEPNPPNPTQPAQPTESSQPTDSSSQRSINKENYNNRGRKWRSRNGRVERRRERVNLHQQKTLLSAVTDAVAGAILKHTSYRGHYRGRGRRNN
ncbi:zinc finger homeobox protein 4-like isoform X2 [Anthonomus grandis grandis]|uniref:zinc finger homeobox protein 4-like isoform X1 n=1 Tax=Anthonomus grandis grandis TaxID=2921223 RepID=UPI002165536A|nr:zinc finger homeobox protein 4-like isoform X1 [Anthonomus grandis grandis]XP_050313043.1 zinc finger homeobox protein 4-like isoform X2 [Anthonomus grandis grandis]